MIVISESLNFEEFVTHVKELIHYVNFVSLVQQ